MTMRPPTKRRKREWGLSQAINRQDSVDDVMTILINDPSSARKKDRFDEYPLHLACYDTRYNNVIIQLLEVYPEAAQHKSKDGNYPLHIACRCRGSCHSDTVMLRLIQLFPEAASMTDEIYHLYPLQLVLKHMHTSIVVIRKLLTLHPMALRERYSTDLPWYPIHYAIANLPREVAILLIEADPMVIGQLDGNEFTLWDFAYRHKISKESILEYVILMQRSQCVTYASDRQLRLPTLLHCAILEYVMQRSQTLINARDRQGKTPLHCATLEFVMKRSLMPDTLYGSMGTVRILLKHPDCDVNATDPFGNTPLHYTVSHRNDVQRDCCLIIVRVLLDHWDIRFDQKNHVNQTPLDLVKMEISRIEAMNSNDVAKLSLPIYCTIRNLLEEEYPYRRRCRSYDYLLRNFYYYK